MELSTSDINFPNYQQVYDYYAEKRLYSLRPLIADFVTSKIFSPEIEISKGTLEFIDIAHQQKTPLIITANHVQYHDHNVVSSAIHKIPTLRNHIVAKTVILAKPEYFQDEKSRLKHEKSNVVPIFRTKDMGQTVTNMELHASSEAANSMLLTRLSKGQNIFLFPESTRNNKDWQKLLQLGGQIGRLATGAIEKDIEFGIINLGLAYKSQKKIDIFKAQVTFSHITRDDLEELTGHHQIKNLIRNELQQCVDTSNSKFNN